MEELLLTLMEDEDPLLTIMEEAYVEVESKDRKD